MAEGAVRIYGPMVAAAGKEDHARARLLPSSSSKQMQMQILSPRQSSSAMSFASSSSPACKCFRTASRDTGARKGLRSGCSALGKIEAQEGYPDDDLLALQAALHSAIKYENYEQAAVLRDKIRRLHETEVAAVLATNATFYEAFAQADMELMKRVWLNADTVFCVHPGSACITGYDMVVKSWSLVLLGPLRFDLQDIQVHIKGGLGYLTCVEMVRSQGSSWGRQVATNIFEKQNGEWFLCAHHASPV